MEFQQKWVFKLLSYDFSIDYKRGKENKVVDALLRRNENDEGAIYLAMISFSNHA